LCAITDTLIADADGIYHPGEFNDRLVLGLKGQMAEALSGIRHNASYADFSVMPTMSCEFAAGLAGGPGRSA
jgi:hypothetical protein